MLRSNSKSLENHVVSHEEGKERLQWEGFAEKEGFSGFKGSSATADTSQRLQHKTAAIKGVTVD